MLQRPHDGYASLSEPQRARVDPLLESVGGLAAMRAEVPTRVAYREHRLVIDGL